MKGKKKLGLYIHIPFCKHKCDYCDFNSYAKKENLIPMYMKCLNYELESIGKGNYQDYIEGKDDLIILNTIYIGGGTPSYLDSKYIGQIMEAIKANYILDENAEITIEVNPGTVKEEKLKDYISFGINRISIGLQSSKDSLLKQMGRIHQYRDFQNTYELARKVGFSNINVDLMLGIPNQTKEDLKDSLTTVLALQPEHISVYSLILEEGTPLFQKVETGMLELLDDEIEREMYWSVKKDLEKAGYVHYEISNFAKPGFESKHNMNCWNQEEYIGVGAGAHSYTNQVRYSNIDTIEKYIDNYEKGHEIDNFIFHEKQNNESQMKEYMMLGLRKIQGIQVQAFKQKFGQNPIFLFRKELEGLVEKELIEIDGDFIRLSEKGLDLANLVWEEFVS